MLLAKELGATPLDGGASALVRRVGWGRRRPSAVGVGGGVVLFCLFYSESKTSSHFCPLFKREKKAHTSRIIIDDVFELRL